MTFAVAETSNIRFIVDNFSPTCGVVWDIDQTLIEPESQLGHGRFRHLLRKAFMERNISGELYDKICWHLVASLPYKPVQPDLPEIIQELIKAKKPMAALTARGTHNWVHLDILQGDAITEAQLEKARVSLRNAKPLFIKNSPSSLINQVHNIFFANTRDKGEFILEIIQSHELAAEGFIFIDDNLENVKSVCKASLDINIPCLGIHYIRASAIKKPFDLLIACIQWDALLQGKNIPSDEEAQEMKNLPEYFGKRGSYLFEERLRYLQRNIYILNGILENLGLIPKREPLPLTQLV